MSNHSSNASPAYTTAQSTGVTVLVVVSSVSAIAALGLLCVIAILAFYTRKSVDENIFFRTHVAAYFVCLLLCDGLQAIGSIMSLRWVLDNGVVFGPFCIAQGLVKQAADVGIAMWNVVIALHSFSLLVLEGKVPQFVHWATLVSGWFLIGAVVVYGPISATVGNKGPFYGIAGFWCKISLDFPNERIALDYLFMSIASTICFVLYTLVFLHLRGHLIVKGWRVTFLFDGRHTPDFFGEDSQNPKLLDIAKKMLLHPIAYTILVTPIAIVRLLELTRFKVAFEGSIFCTAVFLLSGTINVVLFSTTQHILPPKPSACRQIRRQSDASISENMHADSFSESQCSSDSPSVGTSSEEQQSDKKDSLIIERSRSFDLNGKSEVLDGSWHPHTVEYREVRENVIVGRKSMESTFSEETFSLHEVQLSAKSR